MTISRKTIGFTKGHMAQGPTQVDSYTLEMGQTISVTVWTYGATLVEVLVPNRNGHSENVVLRFPDLNSYENRVENPYLGATLGRYARCIAWGTLKLDNRIYELDRNYGPHHFHGGSIGFDRFVWKAVTNETDDEISLNLYLNRPHGDQGYPGAISVRATYRLHEDGRLDLEYQATTTSTTIVSLTNHAYWNLAGLGRIDGHYLTINSSRIVVTDQELIPIGLPCPIAGTRFDHTKPRKLEDGHLDHCFVLDDQKWAAELYDPISGRFMCLVTDQPGLAVYSGDSLIKPRTGLCLQASALPNSPNRKDFPSSRLDPGSVYHHITSYYFSVR